MPAVVGPPGTVSFPPQHTQNTLTAALWSENAQEKENVKEVSLVISFQRGEFKTTGHCIWILRTKPETQCNRLLWATWFCSLYLSQHHWPLHFIVWRCQGKCVESIPASPTEHWLCHFEISVGVDPFPNSFLKSPLGMLSFNIYLILVPCGYSYQWLAIYILSGNQSLILMKSNVYLFNSFIVDVSYPKKSAYP